MSDTESDDKIRDVVIWIMDPKTWMIIRCWFQYTHAMSFRVFTDVCQDGQTNEYKLLVNGGAVPFSEWEQAEWEIGGSVKWDGCVDWQTNPDCMAHGCGPDMIQQLTNIFSVAYAVAKRYFDLCDEEVPPIPEGFVEWTEVEGTTFPKLIGGN